MNRYRARQLMLAGSCLLSLGGFLAALLVLLPPVSAAVDPLAGCERYPLFKTVYVCPPGVVYLRKNGRMEFMGRLALLAPMPKPPQERR